MRLTTAVRICLIGLLAACARTTPAPPATLPPQSYPALATEAPSEGYPPPPTQPALPETAEPTRTPPPLETATPVPTSTPTSVLIIYQDFEIIPRQISITVGTQVEFLIQSTSGAFHEPYSTDAIARFDSGPNLGHGASYTFTFQQVGTVTILCGYHPGMRGEVEVVP